MFQGIQYPETLRHNFQNVFLKNTVEIQSQYFHSIAIVKYFTGKVCLN